MKTQPSSSVRHYFFCITLIFLAITAPGQTLINIDFGAGATSGKLGFAATGQSSNDFWNRYRHYEPKYSPGMPVVAHGHLEQLKLADSTPTGVGITVSNAPGVWGNSSGDAMFDSYIYSSNGSNIVVTITGLEAGRYHFYLYGHAESDVLAEQNSIFYITTGTNKTGPVTSTGLPGWQAGQRWRERENFVVVRDVVVEGTVIIEVQGSSGGVPVLNGMQILSRGTAPPHLVNKPARTPELVFTNLFISKVEYSGEILEEGVNFQVSMEAESQSTNAVSAEIFEGDVALQNPKLPQNWKITRTGEKFLLTANSPGKHLLKFELAAKTVRSEPWTELSFKGPPSAVTSITVTSRVAGSQIEMLSGNQLSQKETNVLKGAVGPDQRVALRWQARQTTSTRQTLVLGESTTEASLSGSSAQLVSNYKLEIVQGSIDRVSFHIPLSQSLVKVEAQQLRDWVVEKTSTNQVLAIELLRPVDSQLEVKLFTETRIASLPAQVQLESPTPLGLQRETGTFRIKAEDVLAQVQTSASVAQITAQTNEIAAFRFSTRPASVQASVSKLEPEITSAAHITSLVEETRVVTRYQFDVQVDRAGVYQFAFEIPEGITVSEVTGPEISEWKITGQLIGLTLKRRIMGQTQVEIITEAAIAGNTNNISITQLRLATAIRETAVIGLKANPGILLKLPVLNGVREIPASSLPEGMREYTLAFKTESPAWTIALAAERLSPRIIAEVFNLISIGDGMAGGSATIRLGIINQGVQTFQIRAPSNWRNVELVGANIRRQDRSGDVYTITLQDKVWGGYTLVATYDFPFDAKQATLKVGGAHVDGAERESGTLAVVAASGLAVETASIKPPLRPIDPTELPEADKALIIRQVLMAARYDQTNFSLGLKVSRHDETAVLDAVADRAHLTTVITPEGEMLTQASFMLKNNERQFQRFQLPEGATLWGVTLNGEPIKAERDGTWLMVSLPRPEDRDQAFSVNIQYAQQVGKLGGFIPNRTRLNAPITDVPGTYAEWEVYVPQSKHATDFGGNMKIVGGAPYSLKDAWEAFVMAYQSTWHKFGKTIIFGTGFILFVIMMSAYSKRHGFSGMVTVLVVFAILAILAGMLLPALAKAKARSQTTASLSNLKQVGIAARLYQNEHERFPTSFEEMMNEIANEKILYDPKDGRKYTYVGGGKSETDPDGIMAFSAGSNGRRDVLFVDGSVRTMPENEFTSLLAQNNKTAALREMSSRGVALPSLALPAPAATKPVPKGLPTAAGLKSIKIEIPKAGKAYTFTRVLNLNQEPPAIELKIMSEKVFRGLQMLLQVLIFVGGLGLAWRKWNRPEPAIAGVTIGITLAVLATAHLFLTWRILHVVLIVLVPLLFIAFVGYFIFKKIQNIPPVIGGGGMAPVASIIVLLFTIASASATDKPTEVAVTFAEFTGKAEKQVTLFDVTLEFSSTKTNASVLLFGKEISVLEFSGSSPEVRLWREGEKIGATLPRGESKAQIKILTALRDEGGRRHLDLEIPSSIGTRVILNLDEQDAEVNFPAAVNLKRETSGNQTRLEAIIGAADRLSLSWMPRARKASEAAAIASVQQGTIATVDGTTLFLRTVMDFSMRQGELHQLQLSIPQRQTVLKITGDQVRSWYYSTSEVRHVTVDLLKPLASKTRINIETEESIGTLPLTLPLLFPGAVGASRQGGYHLAVNTTEEIFVTMQEHGGLERQEPTEIARLFENLEGENSTYWKITAEKPELSLKVEKQEPVYEVNANHALNVGLTQLTMESSFSYNISRAGVFSLALRIPQGYRIQNIQSPAVKSWNELVLGGKSIVEIQLKEKTTGNIALESSLVQLITNFPPQLSVDVPRPLVADKQTEWIAVRAEPGIEIKTEKVLGLIEVPASNLPQRQETNTALLGFKYVSANRQNEPITPWNLILSLGLQEASVRAEVVTFATVSETYITGRTLLRYEAANAPVKFFALRIPSAYKNVEISGAGIRRREQSNDVWQIELQNKVRGEYLLNVTWEMGVSATNNFTYLLHGVSTENTERETGAVAIGTRAALQVTANNAPNDLMRIDVRELPAWSINRGSAPERNSALVFRYVRPGWNLPLRVARFTDAAVLQALVDQAILKTVISDDGQLMTQMELSMQNNGRQSLEVTLPSGSKVWSAFVAGQPVRPAREGNSLLIPLENSGDEAIAVELTYVSKAEFPKNNGKVELESPRLGVPIKDARWELFLPPQYEYKNFKGSMTYESGEALPISQDFTLASYARQEIAAKAWVEAQQKEDLAKAKSELAAQNYKATGSKLSNVRARSLHDREASVELKELELNFSKAQSSNLLQAQDKLVRENSERFGVDAAKDVAGVYDVQVAGKQVAQLQKIQEVASSRVAPLRVNLPTRGLHHSFVQVLQTETDKPLTITFTAKNAETFGFLKTMLLLGCVFATIFSLVAAAFYFKKHGMLRFVQS